MIENTRSIDRTATLILIAGCAFVLLPLVFVVITATQSFEHFLRHNFSLQIGWSFFANLKQVWMMTDLPIQTWNSFVVAFTSSAGRCLLAFTTAYAVVFFAARYGPFIYAAVLASIMLPLDLMVITAYQVTANVALPVNAVANAGGLWSILTGGAPLDLQLNLLDSYAGMSIPLMAQGTGTLILVQYFRTLPKDLVRAATMDGAGPIRFMVDILWPLSRGPLTALFIYLFIGGWVQYLWPLVVASSAEMQTAVVGLTRLDTGLEEEIPNFPLKMTGALMVTIIPLVLIAISQRMIVRGLTMSEK